MILYNSSDSSEKSDRSDSFPKMLIFTHNISLRKRRRKTFFFLPKKGF